MLLPQSVADHLEKKTALCCLSYHMTTEQLLFFSGYSSLPQVAQLLFFQVHRVRPVVLLRLIIPVLCKHLFHMSFVCV